MLFFQWPEQKFFPENIDKCLNRMASRLGQLPLPQQPLPIDQVENCNPLIVSVTPITFTHAPTIVPLEAQMMLVALWAHIKKYSYYREMAVDTWRGSIYIGRIRLYPFMKAAQDGPVSVA